MDSYEESKKKTIRYGKIKQLLKKTFGYGDFRKHQYKIINTILNKKDVCAILASGYGKSLCFQLPAIYKNKPSIVISPLIALMDDQQQLLEKIGIKSCCYNSTVKNKELLKEEILKNKYSIIYITPESIIKCISFIKKLAKKIGIVLFAIDEAHCISSFGFEFRGAYRELDILRKHCPEIPIMAVTATATNEVVKDINKVLKLDGTLVKTSFDRPNLSIFINKRNSSTIDIISHKIKQAKGPCIIYCLTKKDTEKLYTTLGNHGIKVGMYHAGLKTATRQFTQYRFINEEIKCMVATIAFGMGINKSNVRLIVHFGCPKNLEAYYQEIGRAGRDGKPSNCHLYYATKDFIIQKRFIKDIQDPRYKATRLGLLDTMMHFVNTCTCRKKMLLSYFGDKSVKERCEMCDNCLNGVKEKSQQTKKILSEFKNNIPQICILLNVINEVDCSYGATIIIGIIRGSRNKKIPRNYYKSDYYNTGNEFKDQWWKNLLDKLMDIDLVESYEVAQLVCVPRITNDGIRWLNKNGNRRNKKW
jgi:RecQ family ATP-dependent DNA helicase